MRWNRLPGCWPRRRNASGELAGERVKDRGAEIAVYYIKAKDEAVQWGEGKYTGIVLGGL
jgi:hypothetical protein